MTTTGHDTPPMSPTERAAYVRGVRDGAAEQARTVLDPIAEQWERQLLADDLTDVLTGALTEWANRGATGGPCECAHYLTACVTAGYTLDPDTYRQV